MLTHLALIVMVVLLMYYRTFNYGYIIDDTESVRPKDQETKNVPLRIWEHIRGRKYTDSRLGHILTTLLHTINCCLIYLVFGANDVAFLASILFAINPVTNQASIWLSGKPYALSTMFLLLGLLIIPLMPLVYGFCVWWAPNALFFPTIFLMKQPHWYAVLLPLVGFLFLKKFKTAFTARFGSGTTEMTVIKPRKLILVFKTLGYYLCHCLVPIKIGMCHYYLHNFGLSPEETKGWYKPDRYMFLGIGLCLAGIFALFHVEHPVAYGFLWFMFLTVQWCNFVMVNHPITERYIYLPTIGLMYALAYLIINTPAMYVFLTFYAVRLYYFMPAYFDIKTFWKSNVENFPNVAMGYNQYGLGLLNFGNIGSTIDVWVQGVQLRPKDFRLNYNLANIMLGTGNTTQALQFIKTAEESLDQKNNYEFWRGEINKMIEELKRRGIQYEHPLQAVTG